MPFPKYPTLLMGLLLLVFPLSAQKARYADSWLGYDVKIPGLIKNTIHVWSSSSDITRFASQDVTLTLHIFSTDMHLLREKAVPLGEIRFWFMNFQYTNTGYYVNIVSMAEPEKPKRRILKIDQDGNFTEINPEPGFWASNFAAEEKNRFYASDVKGDNVFSIKIEHAAGGDSTDTGGIMALPGEQFTSSRQFEKIVVKKFNRTTREWIQQEYGTNGKRLYNPHISIADTTLLASVMTDTIVSQESGLVNRNPRLLVARFDTSLSDASASAALLKSINGKKNERYSILGSFALKNNLLVISIGVYQQESVYFVPENQNGILVQTPRSSSNFVSNSLKLSLFNEQNKLLKDTLLEDREKGEIFWNNSSTVAAAGKVHFFCLRKYTGSKYGVLHISIAADGTIEQEDMIVNPRYAYHISAARQLQPGFLLIPYSFRTKTGLMQLAY